MQDRCFWSGLYPGLTHQWLTFEAHMGIWRVLWSLTVGTWLNGAKNFIRNKKWKWMWSDARPDVYQSMMGILHKAAASMSNCATANLSKTLLFEFLLDCVNLFGILSDHWPLFYSAPSYSNCKSNLCLLVTKSVLMSGIRTYPRKYFRGRIISKLWSLYLFYFHIIAASKSYFLRYASVAMSM